jgi:L-fucose isomerase-like protein
MRRYNADVVTSPGCMNTIIKIAKTPPCLSYSVLNDEGYAGICEGDFVAIPAYLLLRLITSKPVFFGNPTYPHNGVVLMAHCTAPRRMSGVEPEPAEVVTHYESDEDAAIRVLIEEGSVDDPLPALMGGVSLWGSRQLPRLLRGY